MEESKIRKYVRDRYAGIARQGSSCCGPETSCGCTVTPEDASQRIGYSEEELKAVPPGSNLGLGCGNPIALASLKEGETVLDLGSGAGFDCFLAAREVGPSGRVIGVDMTPEMVGKARENARKGGVRGCTGRPGESVRGRGGRGGYLCKNHCREFPCPRGSGAGGGRDDPEHIRLWRKTGVAGWRMNVPATSDSHLQERTHAMKCALRGGDERACFGSVWGSADWQEGVSALLAKRTPRFGQPGGEARDFAGRIKTNRAAERGNRCC